MGVKVSTTLTKFDGEQIRIMAKMRRESIAQVVREAVEKYVQDELKKNERAPW